MYVERILYDCWLVDGLLGCFDEYAKRNISVKTLEEGAVGSPLSTLQTIYTKEALSANGIGGDSYKLRFFTCWTETSRLHITSRYFLSSFQVS